MTTSATPPVAEAAPTTAPKGGPGKEGGAGGSAGWFTYLALGIVVLLWILPTVGILLTSFRSRDAARLRVFEVGVAAAGVVCVEVMPWTPHGGSCAPGTT